VYDGLCVYVDARPLTQTDNGGSEVELADCLLSKDQGLTVHYFTIISDRVLSRLSGLKSNAWLDFKFASQLQVRDIRRQVTKFIEGKTPKVQKSIVPRLVERRSHASRE
jgi:hypothetical protein